eukprot:CAMPEP_0181317656 /NCGR_PEP_ID=MMETSP1101-20121128/16589_1 /TAXON_ID=46948 /ORGANISM="Rhodomonas abbreviata, Strain Caron Lab Isolate" /LENGTH=246 /DNA_ID=CAMNT_0023425073 /DNA_START=1337 /DNA_END=2074 /DNA_ORIENTATION=+
MSGAKRATFAVPACVLLLVGVWLSGLFSPELEHAWTGNGTEMVISVQLHPPQPNQHHLSSSIQEALSPPNLKPKFGLTSWPRVFLLGVQKAGTSSLSTVLLQHPQICGGIHSQRYDGEGNLRAAKEQHFFGVSGVGHGKAYLRRYAANPDCQVLERVDTPVFGFDGTPSMICDQQAQKQMKKLIPAEIHDELRFIVVLREPVARDLAWHNHRRFRGFLHPNTTTYKEVVEKTLSTKPGAVCGNLAW